VRALLAAGAHTDPLIANHHHRVGSPLNCAARNAHDRNLIQALLDAGAEVDAAGVDGRTPLLHAARTDNVVFVEVLLERGASTDAVSAAAGQTVLTAAVAGNCHGDLRLLLLQGINGGGSRPPLRAPCLLETAARYADCETLGLLGLGVDRVRLEECGKKSDLGAGLEEVLRQRHDGDEKLRCVFADFLAIVRGKIAPEGLMEQGLGLGGGLSDPDGKSNEKGSSDSGFSD
jgi:hypothetical protein